jgi:hypothetical protein
MRSRSWNWCQEDQAFDYRSCLAALEEAAWDVSFTTETGYQGGEFLMTIINAHDGDGVLNRGTFLWGGSDVRGEAGDGAVTFVSVLFST